MVEDQLFLQKFTKAVEENNEEVAQEMLPEGGVLCIMREECTFLKGVPMPKDYEVKTAGYTLQDEDSRCWLAQIEVGVWIEHRHPCNVRPSYVALSKTRRGSSCAKKSLYEELKELMLAGYRLYPDIKEKAICSDAFLQEGVRELISRSEPFYSGELRCLFAKVEQIVGDKKSLIFRDPGRCQQMEPGYITEWAYPEGLTRVWTVVEAKHVKKVSLYDRMCIFLKGERFALEGRLHDRDAVDGGPPDRSLLFLKRRGALEKPSRPLASQRVSAVESLLEGVPYNVAILVHKGAEQLAAFCPTSVISMGFSLDYDGTSRFVRMACRRFLHWMFLKGYVLKYPACDFVDYSTVSTQQVRKVACHTRAFTSRIFQNALAGLGPQLGNTAVGEGSGFGVITPEDVDALDPERQKLLWTIVEDEGFVADLVRNKNLENITQGTVFCVIRGESAILQGVPVSKKHKVETKGTTLWQCLSKNIVLDSVNRKQSTGRQRVRPY